MNLQRNCRRPCQQLQTVNLQASSSTQTALIVLTTAGRSMHYLALSQILLNTFVLPLLENNCLDPSAAAASTTLLHLTIACLQTAEQAVLATNVQQVICVALHNSSATKLLQAN